MILETQNVAHVGESADGTADGEVRVHSCSRSVRPQGETASDVGTAILEDLDGTVVVRANSVSSVFGVLNELLACVSHGAPRYKNHITKRVSSSQENT